MPKLPNKPSTSHELVARYAERVNYLGTSGCWVWLGYVNSWGYGQATRDRVHVPAHRLFYEVLVGPIPEGMVVDHMCRNRLCVNPTHLQVISQSENVGLGRLRNTHCPQGHPYEGDNLTLTPAGHRRCRACTNIGNSKARLKRLSLATKES